MSTERTNFTYNEAGNPKFIIQDGWIIVGMDSGVFDIETKEHLIACKASCVAEYVIHAKFNTSGTFIIYKSYKIDSKNGITELDTSGTLSTLMSEIDKSIKNDDRG